MDGHRWTRDAFGRSGSAVWRLHADGRDALYLKYGTGLIARDIADEHARFQWLAAHDVVPAVVAFVSQADSAWLLTKAAQGRMLEDVLAEEAGNRVAVVQAVGTFLRRLHAISPATCMFDARAPRSPGARSHEHQRRRVQENEFDDERAGWTAEQVWAAIHDLLPLSFEEVVTHGDFSTRNIFISNGAVTACIDVGRVGIADPYQDLAICGTILLRSDPRFRLSYGGPTELSAPISSAFAFT
jgi:aminoglycoside 3'-phosphotransferase-1